MAVEVTFHNAEEVDLVTNPSSTTPEARVLVVVRPTSLNCFVGGPQVPRALKSTPRPAGRGKALDRARNAVIVW